MAEVSGPNNINLVDNIKNVKFNGVNNEPSYILADKTSTQNIKPPQYNFTPEQIRIAQQMTNMINQTRQQQFQPQQSQSQQSQPQQFQPQQSQSQPQKGILKDYTRPIESIATPDLTPQLPQSNDFYSIFGFQISKTTIYILIAFIIIVVVYIIYSKWTAVPKDKKKRRREPEVTYQDQGEKIESTEQ